ncbi:hypothetical protein [Terracidiphilus gabretensis]|uniref:hypothetical protein n=1 Tax=Terracidiphilus gabretensis TaxID=1577687 RepID=UPI00071B589D|nr:hypothetical protein [Terracidiphilus gabretensis]
MRNITVSVPDEVYTAARTYANPHETSISSMVADFLFTLPHCRQTHPQLKELGEPGFAQLHSPGMRIA